MHSSTLENAKAFIATPVYEHRYPTALKSDLIIKSADVNSNIWKRTFDIIFTLLLMFFVFIWLIPLTALLIKISSKGPVFFIQDRIGLNGNIFKCYKFRTMKVSSVKYMYTPTDRRDPRVTSIGQFLRKSNLDELPQFFNVLKGEMSIVGPRPHAIAFHKTYATFIEYIDDRLLIKPGITGLAQIRGYRGDVKDFEENTYRTKKRIVFDILYIRQWSLKRDFWIVYTTFMQMLGRKTGGQ